MKAWEEHAADLYLLANDILENQYAQRHGYKSRFYYRFNPTLPYRKMGSDPISQLKLLEQLADQGAIAFEMKNVSDKTPREMLGSNVLHYRGNTILLKIAPRRLAELLEETQKYGERFTLERNKATIPATLKGSVLMIAGFAITFREGNSRYLLQIILENRTSKRKLWTHKKLYEMLEPSDSLEYPLELVRNTANNVNKRISTATEGAVPALLQVTTKTVQLDPRFV